MCLQYTILIFLCKMIFSDTSVCTGEETAIQTVFENGCSQASQLFVQNVWHASTQHRKPAPRGMASQHFEFDRISWFGGEGINEYPLWFIILFQSGF